MKLREYVIVMINHGKDMGLIKIVTAKEYNRVIHIAVAMNDTWDGARKQFEEINKIGRARFFAKPKIERGFYEE